MGARIEAVATARGRGRLRGTGAIRLADEAAKACLGRAGRTPAELDFLINAGIYRDRHLAEPAMAAIIQEDIHANPDPPLEGGHGTFSFDVLNGGCSALNGIHVLDGFLASGAVRSGMVVAADAAPEPWRLSGFPFPPVGAAILLAPGDDGGRGFTHFSFATFPEFAGLYESSVSWESGPLRRALHPWLPGVRGGRNVLRIEQHPDYAARCIECAAKASRRFLEGVGLRTDDVGLLVASPAPAGFPDGLGGELGVPADRRVQVGAPFVGAHTAGPLVALEEGVRTGRLGKARRALLVTVGAGITVGTALYCR